MRFPRRILPCILVAGALAAPLATGCRRTVVYDEPSYRQWEQDTHRQHRDFTQRTDAEKRQYDDWRRDHERH